jgi:hypothetical protein
MNATQYREKLEGEKAKIERMQESAEGRKSLILRNRLKSIVGDLMELNAAPTGPSSKVTPCTALSSGTCRATARKDSTNK